jgi:hypothetical protein
MINIKVTYKQINRSKILSNFVNWKNQESAVSLQVIELKDLTDEMFADILESVKKMDWVTKVEVTDETTPKA